MSDWIKIHRSILESYAFANPVSLKVWVWMLLKANYKTSFVPLKIGKGTISVKVERGQFIFGRFKAEEELNLDGSMIYRQLKKFEELEQIKVESNNQYSVITICNYEFYQSKSDKNEQPTNNLRTADEQQMNKTRTAGEHSIEELEVIEYKEFNTKPLATDFNGLPEHYRNISKELISITKRINVPDNDIDKMWNVFKGKTLTGKAFYASDDKVYSHFVDWIKKQDFKNIPMSTNDEKIISKREAAKGKTES